MKKVLTIIFTIIFLYPKVIYSQENQKESFTNLLKEIENSKSGNKLETFAGFYQFAFKSISIKEKSLVLNSSLFSLVKNYDDNILDTKTRKSIVFLRNFQINAKLNLDEKLNTNGYAFGFTYALLNKRDKSFINIGGSDIDKIDDQLNMFIDSIIAEKEFYSYQTKDNVEIKSPISSDELTEIITAIKNGEEVNSKLTKASEEFKTELQKLLLKNGFYKISFQNRFNDIDSIYPNLKQQKANYLKELEKKPLWTMSTEGISNKSGKLNQVALESVFLVGNHSGEFEAKVKYNYADTLTSGLKRQAFNTKMGYNFKLRKKGVENAKSYFELKLYGEYNKVFRNPSPEEKKETILFNTDFRIKLNENFWLPITIKYDKDEKRFLGLFNIIFNFDNL